MAPSRPPPGGYMRSPSNENYGVPPGLGGMSSTGPTYRQRTEPLHRGATLRSRVPPQQQAGLPAPGGGGAGLQSSGTKLQRGKTLTRPERHVAPAPLINPNDPTTPAAPVSQPKASWFRPWTFFAHLVTFWAPPFLLSACGVRDKASRQAWREKFALCSIALILAGGVGFATVGLNRVLCPDSGASTPDQFIALGSSAGFVGVAGWMMNISTSLIQNGVNFYTISANGNSGIDVTDMFDQSAILHPTCRGLTGAFATTNLCVNATSAANPTTATCQLGALNPATINSLKLVNSTKLVGWSWDQVAAASSYLVIDGNVVNMTPYMTANPRPIAGDKVDQAIRYVLQTMDASGGKDATRIFYDSSQLSAAAKCIVDRYHAGRIDKITPGCFASQLFLYTSLIIIMSVVLARFAMACVFNWFISDKLVQPPKNLKRKVVSPAVLPAGANIEVNNTTGTAPWTATAERAALRKRRPGGGPLNEKGGRLSPSGAGKESGGAVGKARAAAVDEDGLISMAAIGAELFCVCLVTCYSEGEEGIRTTLDSIAGTSYADERKLLFVVCDGMITGSGEKKSTPDICVGMIDADPRFGNPAPMSYLAVAAGRKAHNQAMVYAGHYLHAKGHRTPIIVIVKCGTPDEVNDAKPGNRGKRDSQLILMNFFSRVTYNDRMTPLDYDLFRKTHALMGVTPDFFEVCLMVDADTKVYKDSLKQLVNCMQHDSLIMGVCGETRIANKRQSWVTAIQVYEYFISHHLAKAFESVFGGVTCLPGCFSMYRLKARKANDSDWVPVLVQSEICREYSQAIVTTLHQKNLLLLGEDRFLTTSMIRTFPARKMMFCPQAVCRTVAPDTFRVLLSQRRRWINSTVHNLMELVRVPNLCGTFCFSMQCLTYTLIINYAFNPPKDFSDAIPLLLLGGVLGLPAILILLTTRKVIYLTWMLVYLIALPVWNFILPVYAFWHFDDFSWGETRKVAGEMKDAGHGGDSSKTIEVNTVPLRRWDAWERSRLRKLKRDDRRRRELEQQFGPLRSPTSALSPSSHSGMRSSTLDSDSASFVSREEDRWGAQIGAYHEDAGTDQPPPVGLYAAAVESDYGSVATDHLTAVLDAGWDDAGLNDDDGASSDAHGRGAYQRVLGQSSTPPPPPMPRIYNAGDPTVIGHSAVTLVDSGSMTSLPSPGFHASPEPQYIHTLPEPTFAQTTATEWRSGHRQRRSNGKSDDFDGPPRPYDARPAPRSGPPPRR